MTVLPLAHGSKHTCASCTARFYDLQKTPATCPKCGTAVVIKVKAPPRKRRSSAD